MPAQIISFHCILKNRFGKVLSESYNNDVITADEHSGTHLKGLINGLKNIKNGETRKIAVDAPDAYGFYEIEKIKRIHFSEASHTKVGDTLFLDSDATVYRVIKIEDDKVVLDGNHPLAGQDLIFEIKVLKVRDAAPHEIENHSPYGDEDFH